MDRIDVPGGGQDLRCSLCAHGSSPFRVLTFVTPIRFVAPIIVTTDSSGRLMRPGHARRVADRQGRAGVLGRGGSIAYGGFPGLGHRASRGDQVPWE